MGRKAFSGKLTWVLFALLFAMLGSFASTVSAAYTAADYAIMLQASVQRQPAQISISWTPQAGNNGGYQVYRKNKGDANWGTAIAQLPSDSTGYTDTQVEVGQAYEYWVYMTGGSYASGYLYAGIDAPAVEQRGAVILIIDKTHSDALAFELGRLQQDLVGDGWKVIKHEVFPENSPQQVKQLIQADYAADPSVKSVFLFGRIPVFRSANIAPDGHAGREWPADSYYGDMDGVWSDVAPPAYLPSDLELEVGRVDMSYLPTFAPLTETDLLRRYLDKDHAYRMGKKNLQNRAFIHDTFGVSTGEPLAANGWGNFSALTGPSSIQSGKWKNTLLNSEYLFTYICGGGTDTAINSSSSYSGDLCSADLAANAYKTNFALMFGSYFGEWDRFNNLMRSFLAMRDYGLTSMWAGRPNWYLHHLGLGETFGYSTKISQNNSELYQWRGAGSFARFVHVALMGDPTLRLNPVRPPSNVAVARGAQGNEVSWDAPDQPVLGYYVYRKDDEAANYERVSSEMVTDTRFLDDDASAKQADYMVRAVVLEQTPSGTFHNLSQGAFESVRVEDIRFTNRHGGIPQDLFPGTYLEAQSTVHHSGPGPKDVTFILACYNEQNALQTLVTNQYRVDAGGKQQVAAGFYLPEEVEGCYVKAFLWDGFENMQSLGEHRTFSKQ